MTQIFTVNTYSLNVVTLPWEDPGDSTRAVILCFPILHVIIKFKYGNTHPTSIHPKQNIHPYYFNLTV